MAFSQVSFEIAQPGDIADHQHGTGERSLMIHKRRAVDADELPAAALVVAFDAVIGNRHLLFQRLPQHFAAGPVALLQAIGKSFSSDPPDVDTADLFRRLVGLDDLQIQIHRDDGVFDTGENGVEPAALIVELLPGLLAVRHVPLHGPESADPVFLIPDDRHGIFHYASRTVLADDVVREAAGYSRPVDLVVSLAQEFCAFRIDIGAVVGPQNFFPGIPPQPATGVVDKGQIAFEIRFPDAVFNLVDDRLVMANGFVGRLFGVHRRYTPPDT